MHSSPQKLQEILRIGPIVAIIEILWVMFPGATGEQLFCDTCF